LTQVAAKAIGAIPSLIFYPIVPFVFQSAFLIYWVAALLYLFSAGHVTRNNCKNSCAAYDLTLGQVTDASCCGYDLHHPKNLVWAILYHIFGFFWTTQFITACCLTTIAGAVAAYYWARGESAVSPKYLKILPLVQFLRISISKLSCALFRTWVGYLYCRRPSAWFATVWAQWLWARCWWLSLK
jgi:choline transporter-like protein 2/4/5